METITVYYEIQTNPIITLRGQNADTERAVITVLYIDNTKYTDVYSNVYGPGSVVGIAIGYGLDGPGIEARRGRDFPHLYLGPTQPPGQWVPGLSRG